jgi:hypothetical protein
VQRDWTLALFAVAQILMWVGIVVYNIAQVSFRQGLCPPGLLGRMNATMRFLVQGTMPFGAFLGGVLGTAIGVRDTLLVAALGGSATFLAVFLSRFAACASSPPTTRRPRSRPGPADSPGRGVTPGWAAGQRRERPVVAIRAARRGRSPD